MKWEEAKTKVNSETWAFLELRPTGKIKTKKQYDYVMYYSENTGIMTKDYMKPFEEVKGKYLKLGSWFGGASFYHYCGDEPDVVDECYKDGCTVYEDFSYGKLGIIEF